MTVPLHILSLHAVRVSEWTLMSQTAHVKIYARKGYGSLIIFNPCLKMPMACRSRLQLNSRRLAVPRRSDESRCPVSARGNPKVGTVDEIREEKWRPHAAAFADKIARVLMDLTGEARARTVQHCIRQPARP